MTLPADVARCPGDANPFVWCIEFKLAEGVR